MTANERLEKIGALEIVTGYPFEYLKRQTDEWLIKEHKERVEARYEESKNKRNKGNGRRSRV